MVGMLVLEDIILAISFRGFWCEMEEVLSAVASVGSVGFRVCEERIETYKSRMRVR